MSFTQVPIACNIVNVISITTNLIMTINFLNDRKQ